MPKPLAPSLVDSIPPYRERMGTKYDAVHAGGSHIILARILTAVASPAATAVIYTG